MNLHIVITTDTAIEGTSVSGTGSEEGPIWSGAKLSRSILKQCPLARV